MDIERIKTDLSEKYPPFSDLLQRLQYLDTTYVVTSGTDGQKIIYYNSRILDSEPYPSQVSTLRTASCISYSGTPDGSLEKIVRFGTKLPMPL